MTFNRWCDFLELYVRAPAARAPPREVASTIYQTALGIGGLTLPPDPIQQQPTYQRALAAFQSLPEVRVLFDNGAGGQRPGEPYPGFERSFSRFPIPGTTARFWYLGGGGALGDRPPARGAALTRIPRAPARGPISDFPWPLRSPGGLWTALPSAVALPPAGSSVSYVTKPLRSNTVAIGAGAVRLWVRSRHRTSTCRQRSAR